MKKLVILILIIVAVVYFYDKDGSGEDVTPVNSATTEPAGIGTLLSDIKEMIPKSREQLAFLYAKTWFQTYASEGGAQVEVGAYDADLVKEKSTGVKDYSNEMGTSTEYSVGLPVVIDLGEELGSMPTAVTINIYVANDRSGKFVINSVEDLLCIFDATVASFGQYIESND